MALLSGFRVLVSDKLQEEDDEPEGMNCATALCWMFGFGKKK